MLRAVRFAVCAVLMAPPFALSAQTIRGRVLDQANGEPVADAIVTAMWSAADSIGSIVTDSTGSFFVRAPRAGKVLLQVERIGYRTVQTAAIDLGAGDIIAVDVPITTSPVKLEPIGVEVLRGPVVTGTLLDGYHERRYWLGEQLGLGTFLTRDQLDTRYAVNMSDVMRMLPSVRMVRNVKTGGWNVAIGATSLSEFHGCKYAKVLVDGVWANRRGDIHEEDNDIDLMAIPNMLEGIEVYRGGAQMPAEFGGPTSRCGVVALWTRRGR